MIEIDLSKRALLVKVRTFCHCLEVQLVQFKGIHFLHNEIKEEIFTNFFETFKDFSPCNIQDQSMRNAWSRVDSKPTHPSDDLPRKLLVEAAHTAQGDNGPEVQRYPSLIHSLYVRGRELSGQLTVWKTKTNSYDIVTKL